MIASDSVEEHRSLRENESRAVTLKWQRSNLIEEPMSFPRQGVCVKSLA